MAIVGSRRGESSRRGCAPRISQSTSCRQRHAGNVTPATSNRGGLLATSTAAAENAQPGEAEAEDRQAGWLGCWLHDVIHVAVADRAQERAGDRVGARREVERPRTK